MLDNLTLNSMDFLGWRMVSGGVLPPCRVCNEKGSGLHYGVNTCDACKAFFRRCLTRKTEVRCLHRGDCVILPGKRHHCAACRYKKCVELGMSKNAIKTGRCTHERKIRDIEEVKRLEIQSRIKMDGSLISDEERWKKMDMVIRRLTDAQLENIPHGSEFMASIKEREDQFLRRRAQDERKFLHKRWITQIGWSDTNGKVGVDIEVRRRKSLTQCVSVLEKCIKSFISFVKIIPGFCNMPHIDQLMIIKCSYVSCWAFLFSKFYNSDSRVFIYPYDTKIILSVDDISYFANDEDQEMSISIAKRIQKLDLTEEEGVVAEALCCLVSDAKLSCSAQLIVSASVEYLLEALQCLISRNHDPEDQTLAKIIQIYTDLRSITQSHRNFQKTLLGDINLEHAFNVQ